MRQAFIILLVVCSVGELLTFGVFHAYATSDAQSLSKLAIDGPHSGSDRDNRITRVTERLSGLRDSTQFLGAIGWCIAIGSLLYSVRLLRRQQKLEDKNATLEANLEEKKVAEFDR